MGGIHEREPREALESHRVERLKPSRGAAAYPPGYAGRTLTTQLPTPRDLMHEDFERSGGRSDSEVGHRARSY